MIDEFLQDMTADGDLDALANTFGNKNGRANPSLLGGITVDYYQWRLRSTNWLISVEDARTLL